MRVGAAAVAMVLLACADARALEDADVSRSPYARVLFAALEVEKNTAFLSAGSKFGVTDATGEVTLFVAHAQGFSLSDGERTRRFGWGLDRVERQNRFFVGVERAIGPMFVSLSVGVSQAHRRDARQPDPNEVAVALAGAYGVSRAQLPALFAAAPPSFWRSLTPPRARDYVGGVVDLNLWWRPVPAAYVNLAIVGDTAAQSLWTRLRLGWRVDPLPFAVGPEFSASGGSNWEKLKLGLHIGDATLWRFGLSASGGWMTDETRRWGTYGSVAVHAKF